MHDDDPSPAEAAEEIAASEMARVRDQYADALRILFEGNQRLADDIRKRLSDMQPMLNQLQEVCEGINRYEADAIGALEDDFYADRGDA